MSTLSESKIGSHITRSPDTRKLPSTNPLKRATPDKRDSSYVTPTKAPLSRKSSPIDKRYDNEVRMNFYSSGHSPSRPKLYTDGDAYIQHTSERELMLVQELDRVVEELERMRDEVEHLKAENVQLRQEKELFLERYEDQAETSKIHDESRYELERRLRLFEMDQNEYEQELKKAQLAKKIAEDQLEEYRNQIENAHDDLDAKLEVVLADRNYFESQLRQAKGIQINLEQEIRQKADERSQLISNYEVRISTLQNDITVLTSQKEAESLRQSQNLIRFQAENESLLNEINNLKNIKKNLEAQIHRLKNENLNTDETIRFKLAEAETIKKNTLAQLEKEKKTSDSLRATLQQQAEEFARKEEEFHRLFDARMRDIGQLENKLAQAEKLSMSNTFYKEELDRLQRILEDKTHALEELKRNHNLETDRLQNALSIAQQMNNADRSPTVINLTHMGIYPDEKDKNFIYGYGSDNPSHPWTDIKFNDEGKYETKPDSGREVIRKLGYKGSFPLDEPAEGTEDYNLSIQKIDDKSPMHGDIVRERESPNKEAIDLVKKAGALVMPAEEVKKLKADCANLEETANKLGQKLMKQEEKNVMLMIEVERLGLIVGELQDENEQLDAKIREQNEEYGKQVAGLEKHYEQSSKAQLDNEIRTLIKNFGTERTNLEGEIHRLKLKIDDLEGGSGILKTEVMRLQQTTLAKGKECDEWRIKYDELARENAMLKENLEGELRKKLSQEISGLHSKWAKERLDFENQASQAQMAAAELENKRVLLTNENERLHRVIKERDAEIDSWRARLCEIEQEHQNAIQALKEQHEASFRQRIESEIANRIAHMDSEKGILEKNLQATKAKMLAYEEQIMNLNKEIQLLRQELADKTHQLDALREKEASLVKAQDEIEKWKAKHNQYGKAKDLEMKDLKNQYENHIQRKDHEANLKHAQIMDEKADVESQLKTALSQRKELEEQLEITSAQTERLEQINIKTQAENDNLLKLKKKLEDNIMKNKSDHENELRESLENESRKLTQRFTEEKNQIEEVLSSSRKRLQDSELRSILFSIEIERLHGILIEKEKENEMWKERIFEQESNYNLTINELQKQFEIMLHNRIDSEVNDAEDKFNAQRQALELEINALKSQAKGREESIKMLTHDNQILREEIGQRDADISQLRQKINKIQAENEYAGDAIKQDIQTKLRAEFESQMKELTLRFTSERTALENQIRQMKNRITEMENELEVAQERSEALSAQLRAKEIEMRELAERLEKQRKREVDEAVERLSIEHQNELLNFKNQIKAFEGQNREMKQKLQEYEINIVALSNEIDKLSSLNVEKAKEVDDLRQTCDTIQSNSHYELERLKDRLLTEHNEDQNHLIRDFNTQLGREKQEHEAEIWKLKQAILGYEENLNAMVDEIERLTGLLDARNHEIEVLEGKYNDLEKSKEHMQSKFITERSMWEAKVKELDYINSDLQREVIAWKERYNELDQSKYLEIEEIRTQFDTLKRNSLQASDYEIRLQAERTTFGTQIMQLKQKIGELETEIEDLSKDNQRINLLYLEKKKEVDVIKNSHGAMEFGNHEELVHLRKENEQLRRLLSEEEENMIKNRFDRTNTESQINQLKQALDLHKVEISKLHDILNSRKIENESLTLELNGARQEIGQSNKQYKEIESQYLRLVNSYEHLQQEVGDLKHSRDLYKAQFEQNNIDIAMKNRELIDKIQQVDALKMKYEDAIANVEPIKTSSKVVTKMTIKK